MPVAIPITAAAASAGVKAFSADKAAGVANRAASNAATVQQNALDKTTANYNPYLQAGAEGANMLTAQLPSLAAPVTMDEATLQNTPGYQWNLQQGLKAAQGSAAARGLGSSGAAIKGAEQYATGLADSTYQNQFQNAVTNQTNTYNRLMGASDLGRGAANQLGGFTTGTAGNIASGNVGAANTGIAAINATGAGISNALNTAGGYGFNQSQGLYGGQPNMLSSGGGTYGTNMNPSGFAGGATGWRNPDTMMPNPY